MISRLALCPILLAVLTNCALYQLNHTLWPDYKAYQSQSHYRAFTIDEPRMSSLGCTLPFGAHPPNGEFDLTSGHSE